MAATFQSTVNVQLAFGVPGALYDDSPVRATPWELVSASAAYNIVGATAYTATTADPGSAIASGVAAAGGTGQFVGILSNDKVYATSGTTAGALNPSLSLPNYFIGELVTMGHLIVALPGPANVGDQVCYDNTTGVISTFAKTTSFTASLLTTGVLSVTAVTAGFLQPGMVINGLGVNGVAIIANGTGTGNTGTYTTNYIGGPAISAEAMTAPSLPPLAAAFTANLLTTGTLSVSALVSGQLNIGSVIYGTGVPANATITALGTGTGGTGTYTVSPAPTSTVNAEAMTADATTQIAGAAVIRFQPAGNGGLGVISLTGA